MNELQLCPITWISHRNNVEHMNFDTVYVAQMYFFFKFKSRHYISIEVIKKIKDGFALKNQGAGSTEVKGTQEGLYGSRSERTSETLESGLSNP